MMADEGLGGGPMLWEVDTEADAAYLTINWNAIVETRNFGGVNIDLDANGNAVGIELLSLHPDRAIRSRDGTTPIMTRRIP